MIDGRPAAADGSTYDAHSGGDGYAGAEDGDDGENNHDRYLPLRLDVTIRAMNSIIIIAAQLMMIIARARSFSGEWGSVAGHRLIGCTRIVSSADF